VTHVLPESPAAKAGVRRDDLVLTYNKTKVKDTDHFAQLIRSGKPEQKVQLQLKRGKEEKTVEAILAVGSALILIRGQNEAGQGARDNPANANSAVSVISTPLEKGKNKLTIEYYVRGRPQTVSCQDVPADIAKTVQKLPESERNMVRIALQRLRVLNSDKAPSAASKSPPLPPAKP
jgi:hypothetical protein